MNVRRIGLYLFLLLLVGSNLACAPAQENGKSTDSVKETVGAVVPFSGYDLNDNQPVDVNMLKAKKINLVTIWQPECPPCEIEGQALNQIAKNHEDIGVIGLCVADSNEEVINTVKAWGLNYTNYRVDEKFLTATKDKVKKTPTLFFVDDAGRELLPMQEGLPVEKATAEEVVKHLETVLGTLKK